MGGAMFSGSSQRRQAVATATAQQSELDRQRTEAQNTAAAGLSDKLDSETTRLLRSYNSRALLAGGR